MLCRYCYPPAFAADVDPARADLLLQLFRDNGCQMTDLEAGEILPDNGFSKKEFRDIIRAWDDKDMLAVKGALRMELTAAACAGE